MSVRPRRSGEAGLLTMRCDLDHSAGWRRRAGVVRPAPVGRLIMRLLSAASPFAVIRELHRGDESSTFVRLGKSRHVADLRLIFWVTVIMMVAASVLALAFDFEHEVMTNWSKVAQPHGIWLWMRIAFDAVSDSGVFIGAVVSLGCGVLTWTYQTGSSRLGVVDLFACEIATLCRVGTIVDMVKHFAEIFAAGDRMPAPAGSVPATANGRFTSQESYFSVFDSTIKDLQSLEAGVVKNVTAFYTYMKVMRDYLRKFDDLPQVPDAVWHRTLCNIIYMQFLGFESARLAILDLVEFEPRQAEDLISILLSELPAYRFLLDHFSEDFRYRRLALREPDYRRDVPSLYQMVMAPTGKEWQRAQDTAEELAVRYQAVFGSPIVESVIPARSPDLSASCSLLPQGDVSLKQASPAMTEQAGT
jgi:hypothetical protein